MFDWLFGDNFPHFVFPWTVSLIFCLNLLIETHSCLFAKTCRHFVRETQWWSKVLSNTLHHTCNSCYEHTATWCVTLWSDLHTHTLKTMWLSEQLISCVCISHSVRMQQSVMLYSSYLFFYSSIISLFFSHQALLLSSSFKIPPPPFSLSILPLQKVSDTNVSRESHDGESASENLHNHHQAIEWKCSAASFLLQKCLKLSS